jgi:8-oxo-dGTP diphosphatase
MEPHQGAAAAILDDLGRLLLVKEGYDRRRYMFPGGALEPGESPLDAVVREAREETGVVIGIDHVIGVYRLVSGITATLFRCSIETGEPAAPDGWEIAEVGWFLPDEIPHPRSNILHHALDDVVAGRSGVVRDGPPPDQLRATRPARGAGSAESFAPPWRTAVRPS